jgi:hypothetical protein
MFWVPSAGHLGLGVSLLSYAGSVWVGVQSDAGLVPDPELILAGFDHEVAALLALGIDAAADREAPEEQGASALGEMPIGAQLPPSREAGLPFSRP